MFLAENALHLQLLSLSYQLVNQGRYTEACNNFNTIIAACPELAVAYVGRGTALAMLEQIHAAVSDFTEAIKLQPNLLDAYKRRGQARAAIGQEAAAVEDLDMAISLAGKMNAPAVEFIVQRGLLRQRMGNFPGALEDLRAGLESSAGDASLWNHRGLCCTSMGRTAAALEFFRTCLGLDPGFTDALVNMGQAHKEAGDFEAARGAFDEALAKSPACVMALHLRGLLHHSRGDHARACADFEEVRRLDPKDSTLEAAFMIGACHQARGFCHKAVEVYSSVITAGKNNSLHALITHMAFYQRELCRLYLSSADAPLSGFCLDDVLTADFKEAWCKKAPPQKLLMKGYAIRSAEATAHLGDLSSPVTVGDTFASLCACAMRLGRTLQYRCHGFHANVRQHRMAGFATVQCAQMIRRCQVSRWREAFEAAVLWRQLSEPLDAVCWINKLKPEAFAAGFGSHTPLVTGWTHVIRYYPQFERTFSIMKSSIIEKRVVYNASSERVPVEAGKLGGVAAARGYAELFDVFGFDFWVVTPCHSMSRPGHIMDGTRITLQRLEPRHRGYEFSIRTPCTPARWEEFEVEMGAAWDECMDRARDVREELGQLRGGEEEAPAGLGLADLPAGSALHSRCLRLASAALRVSFYWYNFMPLSRGSAAIGFVMLHAMLLSAGLEISSAPPEGQQIDWEAITTPSVADFEEAVLPTWLHGSLRIAGGDVLEHLEGDLVTSMVPSIHAMFYAMNYPL